MRQLPGGTVTFLFTDIEGSTRLLERLGGGYAAVLAEQRRLLRAAVAGHNGVEVDTQGDSFFVAFARASDAVAAAVEAQQALARIPVRVRMGIHTSEPSVTAEGYVGMGVHLAARIMGAGHGGQVLLSEATRRLLPDSVALRDLGEHRLKDLGAPQRLYQLGVAGFPPLRTLYRTNLPIQPTAIVGRRRELEEAGALLQSHRLVTLVGPGGSGKTRLALQLAAEQASDFPDGVYWVPLQALRDARLVEAAVRLSLGADEDFIVHVGARRLLLLLDNFEQIVEAAPIVSLLLARTPNAKVLVTSREPLQIDAEQRYPVEPLPNADAAVLFLERARSVAPDFRPSRDVAEICRLLDGLPLAIELAAARVALLSPSELLTRLDRRLPLLATRSRDAPARQRTLRSTIEWSYELLEPKERALFSRLAVFRGSFSLTAAEAICAADLDAIESLMIKNLLRSWRGGRLGMLDTIREYAADLFQESAEADALCRRHAEFFLAVAERANLNPGRMSEGGQHLEIANTEQDNIRGALAWALDSGAVELGFKLANAMDMFWTAHDPHEGIRWFSALLSHPAAHAVATEPRAHALRGYGSSLSLAGESAQAEPPWRQSLALFDQLNDDHGRAVLLHRLGDLAMLKGDLERARSLVEESQAIHERSPERWERIFGLAQTTGTLGAIARDAGDAELAAALIQRSAAMGRDVAVPWWEAGMLAELACLSLNARRIDQADAHARRSLTLADQLRDRAGRVFGIGLLAAVAAARGHAEQAGCLWAAIEKEHAVAPLGGWRRHRHECELWLDAAAGPDLERGRATGRTLTLDQAAAQALTWRDADDVHEAACSHTVDAEVAPRRETPDSGSESPL